MMKELMHFMQEAEHIFFIGKRGGITYPVHRIKYKNGNYRKHSTKTLGKFEGFFHIVCEQDRM